MLIAYQDDSVGQFSVKSRIRVQRVDSSGNLLWGINGVRVTLSETNQGDQAIISDGRGGCIVTWVDTAGILRINRIDSLGMRVWGDSGKYVWNSSYKPLMHSDDEKGCYLMYGVSRLQRYDQFGNTRWQSSGIFVPTGTSTIGLDSLGNSYHLGGTYVGYVNGQLVWTANLQKISPLGELLWDSTGVMIDTIRGNGGLRNNVHVTQRSGLSYVAWQRYNTDTTDIFLQLVSSTGNKLFVNPVAVSTLNTDKILRAILAIPSYGAICVWNDYGYRTGVYAQKVDSSGQRIWDSTGIAASLSIDYTKAINDTKGGVIIAGIGSDFAVRAQQVSKNGKLGEIINSVKVNDDQSYPNEFLLFQNYPNPFNSSTMIRYKVPVRGLVSVIVYNLLGQQMKTLVDQFHQPGTYTVTFHSDVIPSGVYFYQMKTEKKILNRKLVILK